MKKTLFLIVGLFALFFIPSGVEAATLYTSPASGNFTVGATFSVTVRVNSQDQAVNTAEAGISYSSDTLELVRVTQGSTFYLPAPGSPAGGATPYFGGGLPTPGYNGTSGLLGTMTFRAKATGTATVTVASGKVLLNDGQGTDALSSRGSARFTITAPAVGTPEATVANLAVGKEWTNQKNLEINWNRPNGAYGFSFEFDQSPETNPDNELDTTVTTKSTYTDVKDGVWYFHIKARGQAPGSAFGNTAHVKISVDTLAPTGLVVAVTSPRNELEEVSTTPTIEFTATDAGSGIASYNIYDMGQETELVTEGAVSPYTFSKLSSGVHKIKVVVLDQAGNTTEEEFSLTVAGPIEKVGKGFLSRSLEIPVYALVGINLLILILIGGLLWLALKRRRPKLSADDQFAQIQADIDQSLEQLKTDIGKKLMLVATQSSRELYQKEQKMADEVGVSVVKTRRSIDRKIGKLNKIVKKSVKKNKLAE